ncbi:hypothetical protein PS623_04682 [Pseudomonas fluorescens]|nr:hypothetical protein PS623_04682 [Pseudomonas fluorescens]
MSNDTEGQKKAGLAKLGGGGLEKPNYPACHREITSQVILNLPEDQRPKERVICMSCTKAAWITSIANQQPQIDCFCLVTRSVTYSTYKRTEVLDCEIIYMLEQEEEGS